MAGFRERARVSNLARTEAIAEALEAMCDGTLPDEVRLRGRAAAHTVAGSAGTFGFHEASEQARAIEALLDDVGARADLASGAHRGLAQLALLRQDLGDPSIAEGHSAGDGSTRRSGDQPCP
ncbi:Hpt domain-containing protein [Terrabacter terrigena]|uniref:Hpt domain-containing protein n=1 Tax=Terrabacter terrigena TaxID=574718 RepID=A0ABW3MSC4_9MICO